MVVFCLVFIYVAALLVWLFKQGEKQMTRKQAYDSLPANAKWFCSFGYPGEGGFVEFHRTPSGERWQITNGPYIAIQPFNWRVEMVGR